MRVEKGVRKGPDSPLDVAFGRDRSMPRGQNALSFPGSMENSGGNRGYEKAVRVAVAIRGAVILGEQEGAYANLLTYRQRCGSCGYVSPGTISVSIRPHDTSAYGAHYKEAFDCPACGNSQMVEFKGSSRLPL